MFYTFFVTLFHSKEDYKHPFVGSGDEIFGTLIFGKFGKEVAWTTECGQWVYLQTCEPKQGSVSKHYRKKWTQLCVHLPSKPVFSTLHRSSHALMLPLTGALKQHKLFTLRKERNPWDFRSLSFEHQMLMSLIASNQASKARAVQASVLTLNAFRNVGASLLGRPVTFTRQMSCCNLEHSPYVRDFVITAPA